MDMRPPVFSVYRHRDVNDIPGIQLLDDQLGRADREVIVENCKTKRKNAAPVIKGISFIDMLFKKWFISSEKRTRCEHILNYNSVLLIGYFMPRKIQVLRVRREEVRVPIAILDQRLDENLFVRPEPFHDDDGARDLDVVVDAACNARRGHKKGQAKRARRKTKEMIQILQWPWSDNRDVFVGHTSKKSTIYGGETAQRGSP